MALLHAEPLRTQLHTKAGRSSPRILKTAPYIKMRPQGYYRTVARSFLGQFECGVKTVHTRGITIEELRKALPKVSSCYLSLLQSKSL